MRASPSSRMPSAAAAPDGSLRPGARPWRTAGLVLLAVWAAVFVAALALFVRVALVPDADDGPNRSVVLLGTPFVLVALGLLWWTWSSARALRGGRREGWTVLLALGGVAVAQTVMTAPGVVSASGSATGSGPPREVVGGMLAMIVLGVVTLTVAVLGRRAWTAADAAPASECDPSDLPRGPEALGLSDSR